MNAVFASSAPRAIINSFATRRNARGVLTTRAKTRSMQRSKIPSTYTSRITKLSTSRKARQASQEKFFRADWERLLQPEKREQRSDLILFLAQATGGRSGRDLLNLVNQAVLNTVKRTRFPERFARSASGLRTNKMTSLHFGLQVWLCNSGKIPPTEYGPRRQPQRIR